MIRFLFRITTERTPKETIPRGRPGDPGWYVLDRGTIVAHCDTEAEAQRVTEAYARMQVEP